MATRARSPRDGGDLARRRLGGRARSRGSSRVPVCVSRAGPRLPPSCRRLRARLAEEAEERLAQRRAVEVRDDVAVEAEADRAALLADDDDDRVGLLGDAERGAVARAERLVEDLACRASGRRRRPWRCAGCG